MCPNQSKVASTAGLPGGLATHLAFSFVFLFLGGWVGFEPKKSISYQHFPQISEMQVDWQFAGFFFVCLFLFRYLWLKLQEIGSLHRDLFQHRHIFWGGGRLETSHAVTLEEGHRKQNLDISAPGVLSSQILVPHLTTQHIEKTGVKSHFFVRPCQSCDWQTI